MLGVPLPSQQQGTVPTANIDPWISFFSLFITFAEMYRTSIHELQEWKKSEIKLTEATVANCVNKFKLSTRSRTICTQQDQPIDPVTPETNLKSKPHVTREDVFSYFKNQLTIIRQRNAASEIEDDDSDSGDEELG